MYCKSCGSEMNENQAICLKCGCATGTGTKYCANCGGELNENAVACMNCGVSKDFGAAKPAKSSNTGIAGLDNADWLPEGKDKLITIILTLFLGGIGVHNFYLGETKKGIFKLLLCWCGVGGILALIDLIKMLTGSYKFDPDKLV